MAKKIGLDRIEARLGRGPGSGGRGAPPPDDDDAQGGSKLFGFGLLAIFVVGAGALASTDAGAGFRQAVMLDVFGPSSDNFQSSVAAACDPGWKDDRINRDQIHCYMTRDVARLCNPRERLALVDKLRAYQTASDGMEAAIAMTAFGVARNPNVVAMGMAEAKSHDPKLSGAEQAEQTDKVWKLAGDTMGPADKILAASQNIATPEDLRGDVRSLAERGFLAAADFPDKMPKIVRDGLASAGGVIPTACP